jgi:hypothetical protein
MVSGAFAVLRDQDDPVHGLRDAVVDLLELAVRVLVGVPLEHGVAGLAERGGDGQMSGHPELGLEVLEGEAYGGRLCGRGDHPAKRQCRDGGSGPDCGLHVGLPP